MEQILHRNKHANLPFTFTFTVNHDKLHAI